MPDPSPNSHLEKKPPPPANHAEKKEKDPLHTTHPYIHRVQSLLDRYPNLQRLHMTMISDLSDSATSHSSRAAVVEIDADGTSQHAFPSPHDLQHYVAGLSSAASSSSECAHRIYLLEGLAPSYVEILGTHLRVDPYVFAEQLLRGGTRKGETAMLPSRRDKGGFSMQYVEPRMFGAGIDDLGARCLYQERKIWATKINGKFDGVGHVHRIASFWSRSHGEGAGGGFDALILLDPPVGNVIKIGKGTPKKTKECPSTPYQGGYVDILPFSDIDTAEAGPSRNSPFDDLLFYWSHADKFPNLHFDIVKGSPAESTSFILKKLIASNWMPLLVYFDVILDRLEYALARSDFEVLAGAEKHWSDVEFWHRRCRKSCDQLEQTLFDLRRSAQVKHSMSISIPGTQASVPLGGTDECTSDFEYLYEQMLSLKERSQRLGSSLTNLIGIIQSKRSSDEAHGVRILTLLGMLFVPLAFIATLFSMSGEYAPSGDRFWVYFATSLPMVALVFAIVFAQQVAERLNIKKRTTKAFLEPGQAAGYAKHVHGKGDVEALRAGVSRRFWKLGYVGRKP